MVYVGKAKNCEAGWRTTYPLGDGRPKIAELRERVSQIDFIVTESETEALVLEANLIKRHRPRFNASLKDDKSYPYIVVTTGDKFPRVYATRAAHDPRHRYFGPFPSAGSVHATLDVLNKTFPFRKCRGPEPGRRSGVPCLNYHIGRSVAPCIGAVTREEYDEIISDVIDFLEGRVGGLIRDREEAMRVASREMDFERAAKLRDQVAALSHVRDRQQATIASEDFFDAFGAFTEGETAGAQVFAVREGQIVTAILSSSTTTASRRPRTRRSSSYPSTTARRVPREVRVQPDESEDEVETLAEHLTGLTRNAAWRCAGPGAGRSAESWRWRYATRSWGSSTSGRWKRPDETGSPPRSTLPRGARAPQAPGPHRVLRHLQHHGDQLRGLYGRVPGRPAESASTAGSGHVPSRAPTTSPAWPRCYGATSAPQGDDDKFTQHPT